MKRSIPSTILVAAMVLLLLTSGQAADKNTVEGIVVPDSISDKQPFTFAVPQSVEGEVVNIQTVEGQVVQHASADKYGRIFLAAGLPAGAYLISTGSHGQPIGKLEIKPQVGDALQHVSQPLRIMNPPQVLKLSNPFSLNGTGFSPNCADMRATLNGPGKTEAPIVLAATKDQLKLAPIQQLQPGMAQLRVTNQATGQSTESQQLLLYNISGELGRRTIKSGHDETRLTLRVQPANMALRVKVNVVSGPVDFGQGRKEVEAVTDNGQAVFPVHAEHGAGSFQLSWELVPVTSDTAPKSPEVAAFNEYTASHPHGSANLREAGFSPGLDEAGSAASIGNSGGGIFGDSSGKKDKKDDTNTSTTVSQHSKHCEWRFLRVEKTNYTMDDKELAENKAKLGKALLSMVGKVAPAAGQVTKAVLSALSISRANNVYLVYILVEIVDGSETVIDTKVVGPLEDKEAMDFWANSDADGARQSTILRHRNELKSGCPAR